MSDMEDTTGSASNDVDIINSLPEEILERILSYLSPYGQCKQAACVCRSWNRVIQGVIQQSIQNFQLAAAEGTLRWSYHECPTTPLTSRHSHNMCRMGENIYVFGGCSSSLTAFNDMWKLDLGTRKWTRVLALGSCPSPKAAATMVTYRDALIIFGGWAPPVPYPLHQAPHIFNELQVFNIRANRWNLVVTTPCPPPVAGHQACVVSDRMVVFGGMIDPHHKSNDLYELDLGTMTWRMVSVSGPKPSPRYGHLQYLLGDRYILVIGGCGISNTTLSDAWLLEIGNGQEQWKWKEIEVRNEEHAAPVIFGHPACKVGTKIIVFGRSKNPQVFSAMRRSQVIASAPRQPPAPSGPQIPKQRPHPTNARRELRNHGLLLNGSNKRLHIGGESEKSIVSQRGRPSTPEDMKCQPSTSGQGMECQPSASGQGTSASDSQVCDELHPNTAGAANTSDMTASLVASKESSMSRYLGNGGVASSVSNLHGNPDAIDSNMNLQGTDFRSPYNHYQKVTGAIKKSNLNQAHTGHFSRRKETPTKVANVKAPVANNSLKCLCSKQALPTRTPLHKHHMQQYVLDTAEVITSGCVTWQPIKEKDADHVYRPITAGLSSQHGPPPETCFTSVCEGRGELIMFGGLLENSSQFSSTGKSAINNVYYAM